MTGPALGAALAFASRGWPVFPTRDKRPLTEHGRSDATTNVETIKTWWTRWPNAGTTIATGEQAGIVVLDVDIDTEKGVHGLDALDQLGVGTHPQTPTAHTPRGGVHLLFAHPGHFVRTVAGKLGRGLDIRGDGGSITLPPGPGRHWDPYLGLNVPLAPMPRWMLVSEAGKPAIATAIRPNAKLSACCQSHRLGAQRSAAADPERRGVQHWSLGRKRRYRRRLGAGGPQLGSSANALP